MSFRRVGELRRPVERRDASVRRRRGARSCWSTSTGTVSPTKIAVATRRCRWSRATSTDHVLTCPVHGWQYDVRTGKGINPCNVTPLPLPVKVEGDDIRVDVNEGGSSR